MSGMLRTRAMAVLVMAAALFAAIGCGSGAKPDSSSATVIPGNLGPASASLTSDGPANWAAHHPTPLARTGVDTTSPGLSGFHRTWTHQFDGQVYAEPLAVGSRVYVATENN